MYTKGKVINLKACEVMALLKISRPTLTNYKNKGLIKATRLHNGHYCYDKESVYSLFNQGLSRHTVIYARVSTSKQKKDLLNQEAMLQQFCFSRGHSVHHIYSDVASGISFEKRTQFFDMLDEIVNGRVERVVISYKDRLSRVGFELFTHLFNKYQCEIVVMSEVGCKKTDAEDIFEEIVSLLHCYSIKMYSKRQVQKIKEALEGGDE